jgi:hypothetical protein
MLGDEGWNLPHVRAERAKGGDGALVRQLLGVESLCRALERSTHTIKRQISIGEDFAARLKLAERAQHYLLGINAIMVALFIEE